jgi:hypothetical protein
MDIDISIQRLILEGISLTRRQRLELGAAVEAELARLLAEGGLPESFSSEVDRPRLEGGTIDLPSGGEAPDPHQLGLQIARSVYGGIR